MEKGKLIILGIGVFFAFGFLWVFSLMPSSTINMPKGEVYVSEELKPGLEVNSTNVSAYLLPSNDISGKSAKVMWEFQLVNGYSDFLILDESAKNEQWDVASGSKYFCTGFWELKTHLDVGEKYWYHFSCEIPCSEVHSNSRGTNVFFGLNLPYKIRGTDKFAVLPDSKSNMPVSMINSFEDSFLITQIEEALELACFEVIK